MDELYHHGVKGMKWGIRRTPAQLGHTTGSKKKKSAGSDVKSFVKKTGSKAADAIKNHRAASKQKKVAKEEAKQQKKARKKKLSEMSDDELRQRIARLELEQRYASLQPKKVSRGEKLVTDILENSARNIGTQTTTYLMGTAVNNMLREAFEENVVNPKKGQKDK